MDSKAAFDKWLADTGAEKILDGWVDAAERERMRRVMLIVWLASREKLVIELPASWRSAGSTHELMHKEQTIAAIHAAGVSTK